MQQVAAHFRQAMHIHDHFIMMRTLVSPKGSIDTTLMVEAGNAMTQLPRGPSA